MANAVPSVWVSEVSVRDFRNLIRVDLDLGPRFNVISGDNGQGKTNLLESVYAVATSRSFRTVKPGDLVRIGQTTASVRARISEAASSREQSVGLRPGLRSARVDGRRPRNLAEYAVLTPVVVFHPGAVALSTGAGAERRRLLDRVALYRSASALAAFTAYSRASRGRQRILERRGDAAPELDAYEALMVTSGLALSDARGGSANDILPATERAFSRIGPAGVLLSARYARGAPSSPDAFAGQLRIDRRRDRARRSASVGPHRDDIELYLGGLPVRGVASQGQHRAVVLSLELAEIEVLTALRGVRPVLLLDDVSSELDRSRMERLLSALALDGGQVLVTTTRPDLLSLAGSGGALERRDFAVEAGRIVALS